MKRILKSSAMVCALWMTTAPSSAALTVELSPKQCGELPLEEELNRNDKSRKSDITEHEEVDSAAKAIKAIRIRKGEKCNRPGMLVLAAGLDRESATIYYPKENGKYTQSIIYEDGTRKKNQETLVVSFFGARPVTNVSTEIMTVRIPLSEQATIETLRIFENFKTDQKSGLKTEFENLLNKAFDPRPNLEKAQDSRTTLGWLYQSSLVLDLKLASGGEYGREAGCKAPVEDASSKDNIDIYWASTSDPKLLTPEKVVSEISAIIDCQARRDIFFLENHELENVILRSHYHRIVGEILARSKRTGVSKFFFAFHHVTSAFGAGYVDLPKRVLGLSNFPLARKFLFTDPPKIDLSCQDKDMNLCAFVRSTNRTLFEHNRNVMRRLVKTESGNWFDPLGREKQIKHSSDFDRRMVLMEQAIVESQLRKMTPKQIEGLSSLTELVSKAMKFEPRFNIDKTQVFRITCKAGYLVEELETHASKNHFISFRRDDQYIFKPVFENHWWRVAIGVAYVFLLEKHGGREGLQKEPCDDRARDRILTDFLSDYRDILLRILEEAPKKDLSKAAQSTLDDLSNIEGLVEGEKKIVRLESALKTVIENRHWQGCSEKTLEVTSEEDQRKEDWDYEGFLNRLIQEEHSMTLADAFESAGFKGSTELTGFSGGDDAYGNVCSAIEARKQNTMCLIGQKTDCELIGTGAIVYSDDTLVELLNFENENVAALRAELPEVWPFLVKAIKDPLYGRNLKNPDPSDIAKRTIAALAVWEQDIARAQLLANTDGEVLKELDLVGLDYGALVDRALGWPKECDNNDNNVSKDSVATNQSCEEKAEESLKPKAYRDRIEASESWRAQMRSRISKAHFISLPIPYPPPPLGSSRQAGLSTSRLGHEDDKPGATFRLVRSSGQAPDGRQKHRAIGYYEVPGGPGGGKESLLLGLEVEGVVKKPDGTFLALNDGRSNIDVDEKAARKLLSSVGVPELFSEAGVRYELTENFDSLVVYIKPKLLDIELAEIKLVLLHEGVKQQNIAEKLIGKLRESVEDAAADRIRKLLEPLEIDKMIEFDDKKFSIEFKSAQCLEQNSKKKLVELLGPKGLPENGVPPDLRVRLNPKFCLTLGYGEVEVGPFPAAPEIVLDANGLHVEKMGIEDRALNAVEDAINDNLPLERILCLNMESCVFDSVRIELTAGSETIGKTREGRASHGLRIGVNANIVFKYDDQSCIMPFHYSAALADFKPENLSELVNSESNEDKLIEKLKDSGSTLLSCAASIGVDKAIESIGKWFEENGIKNNGFDMFGVNWQFSCGEMNCADIKEKEFNFTAKAEVKRSCSNEVNETHEVKNLIIKIEEGKLRFSLGEDEKREKRSDALGQAIVAQICNIARSFIPEGFLDDKLEIKKPAVGVKDGELYFKADMTLREVHHFGDIPLGRINFANLSDPEKFKNNIKGFLVKFISERLGREIEGEIDLPRVGTFKLSNDGRASSGPVSVNQADDGTIEEIAINGTLAIRDIAEVGMTLKLPVPKLRPIGFEVDSDDTAGALTSIVNELAKKIPFVRDKFTVEIKRFGEIVPGTGKYGLLLDAGVEIWQLELDVEGLAVGIDGVQIKGMIEGSWPFPIEFGCCALTDIGFTYFPGYDSDRQGVIIEADIAPGTGEVARIAKLESQLDLRDIASRKFNVRGDLIVLGTVSILNAEGEVDFADGHVWLVAGTPPMLEKILAADAAVWLGRDPAAASEAAADRSFGIKSSLSVLSVDLADIEARADLGDKGRIYLNAELDVLLGEAEVNYESELDFGNPSFNGKASVKLFKWDAIEAKVNADSDQANASIKVLLFKWNRSAPSIDRISKRHVYQSLRGQLGRPLSEIAKLDPQGSAGPSIRTVTVQRDGSTCVSGSSPGEGRHQAPAPVCPSPDDKPPPNGGKTETTDDEETETTDDEETETTDDEETETASDVCEARPEGVGDEWVCLKSRVREWESEGCDDRTRRAWLSMRSEEGLESAPRPVRATLACGVEKDASIMVELAIADLYHNSKTGKLAMHVQCDEAEIEAVEEERKHEKICGEFIEFIEDNASLFESSEFSDSSVKPEIAYRALEAARAVAFGQGRDSVKPAKIKFADQYEATIFPYEDELAVLMAAIGGDGNAAVLGAGQVEDGKVRERIVEEPENDRTVEGSWTRAILGPWLEAVADMRGTKHPNRMRPRTVAEVEDVLAWTLEDGTGTPEIDAMLWSWPSSTDGVAVETRRVHLQSSERYLDNEEIVGALARGLPQVAHEDKTRVILTRDEDFYHFRLLTFLPMQPGDGDVRISLLDEGPTETLPRVAKCGKASDIENVVEAAHEDSGGEKVKFDLREWAGDPAGVLLRDKLAIDPLSAIWYAPEDKVRSC